MSAYEKPSTWGLPESMAENLGKAMEQKPKSNPLVDLMTSLTNTANEIANLESDPNDWPGWIAYLLEALEVEVDPDRTRTEVIEEVRRGYMWKGKIFRFAQVRVAKPPERLTYE